MMAIPICRRLFKQYVTRAFSFAAARAGNNNEAKIAITAMTTSNSIRVNARATNFARHKEDGCAKLSILMRLFATSSLFVVVGFICQLSSAHSFGAAIWTNLNDGLWRIPTNWNGGNPPRISLGSTYITNSGTKTVTIDAETPITNLFINGLNVWAPAGATNTLFLRDVGTNMPLVVSNQTLTVANRGALRITNSSLVVTGNFISFNVWAGTVTLDSGLILAREEPISSNVTVVTRIGRTNTATLTINGGEMYATRLLLGESPGSQFARSRGVLNMNGGLLTVAAEFSIGDALSCTGQVNMTGGEINALDQGTNVTRVGDFGRGELTVSNAVFNVGNVSVARHDGAIGIVTLQPGGKYAGSDDLSIGRFSGATGLVHVAGGMLAISNNPIYVGREGNGQLVVSNGLLIAEDIRVTTEATNTSIGAFRVAGGMALLSSNLLLGNQLFTNGSVFVSGGELVITNRSGVAALNIQSGTATISGGTTVVDQILVTNALGRLVLVGGTMRSKHTAVDNGMPFTIGDGVTPAEFVLEGGTHSFANGLVISPNAVMSGCGTIVGSVVNNGTLSVTNCSNGGLPSITQQPSSLTVTQGGTTIFSVVANGDPPLSYQWRRGVPGPDATDIPAGVNSSLTITNAQSSDAGSYHVLVTNLSGAVTSSVVTLRVLVPNQIVISPTLDQQLVFNFTSVTGLNYTLEFKNTLDEGPWSPLQTISGTGASLSITNFITNAPTRFFRLRVE